MCVKYYDQHVCVCLSAHIYLKHFMSKLRQVFSTHNCDGDAICLVYCLPTTNMPLPRLKKNSNKHMLCTFSFVDDVTLSNNAANRSESKMTCTLHPSCRVAALGTKSDVSNITLLQVNLAGPHFLLSTCYKYNLGGSVT